MLPIPKGPTFANSEESPNSDPEWSKVYEHNESGPNTPNKAKKQDI